jgi:hypothetical protein
VFPPVIFVCFNLEFMKLLEIKGGATADNYRDLMRRRDAVRAAIVQATEARR